MNSLVGSRLARQFKCLLEQGEAPDVWAFLREVTGLRVGEAVEVFLVHMDWHWDQGRCIPVEFYVGQCAEIANDVDALLDLVCHEFVLRLSRGEAPDPEDYCKRFPRHPDRLLVQLNLTLAVRQAAFDEAEPDNDSQPEEPMRPTPISLGDESLSPPGYEVLEELGQGTSGTVYRARQVKLNRIVALKMILTGAHTDKATRERFLKEAEMVARLSHDGIVRIYEVGECNKRPFISLEYCDGGSLADWLQGTPLPAKQAAWLVEQVARATHHAHQNDIVHRDLKPANVMLHRIIHEFAKHAQKPADKQTHLSSSLGTFYPKITDFGLAKQLESAVRTQPGTVLGTPSYMAPEQAAGDQAAIGPAADTYALGAILYECLTGRPPFKAAVVLDTLDQVRHQNPVPPARLQPNVPRDLETICLKCLRKEPRQRYASALELADDLARFQRGEPVKARPVGVIENFIRWCRRNPSLAASWLGIGVVVLASIIMFIVQTKRHEQEALSQAEVERRARKEAVSQRREAEKGQAQLALEQGRLLCEQGKVGRGLLRMEQALTLAPEDASELQHIVLRSWAVWREELNSLNAVLPRRGPVRQMALSRDGRMAVLTTNDAKTSWSEVPERETITGALEVPMHVAEGTELVAMSPEGTTIVTESEAKGVVQRWDARTGQPLGPDLHLDGKLATLALSAKSHLTLTATWDGTVRLWDTQTGAPLRSFTCGEPVTAAAFSHDDSVILIGTRGAAASLWDVGTGRLLYKLSHNGPAHADMIRVVIFSPDDGVMMTGSTDGTARLWKRDAGVFLRDLPHNGWVLTAAFSPDGRAVVTGCSDRIARLWDVRRGWPLESQMEHGDEVIAAAFSQDGQTIITGDRSGTIRRWTTNSYRPALHEGAVLDLAFSHDGKRLIAGGIDGKAYVWEIGSRKLLHTLIHRSPVQAVAFGPDSKTAVTGCWDGTAQVWDVDQGKPRGQAVAHPGRVYAVAISADGRMLMTGGWDRTACLWDTVSGSLRHTLGHDDLVRSGAFSPDGRMLVTGGWDRKVRMWDVASGTILREFQHADLVWSVSFSPDGETVLTCSSDGTARTWETKTGRTRVQPMQHSDWVRAATFDLRGQTILTASRDRTVCQWDVSTGRPLGPLVRLPPGLNTVALSPDGTSMCSGNRVEGLRLCVVPTLPQADSRQIRLQTEVLTGMTRAPDNFTRILSTQEWNERREQLTRMGIAPAH